MRILILTNYWPPEVGASSHLTFELCTSLVGYGHQVTVVTGFPRYIVQHVPKKYRGKWLYREEVKGIRVIRIVAPSSSGRRALIRSLEHVLVAPPLLLGGLLAGPADVIYTISPPLPLGLTAYLLGKVKRARFVFGIQDIFPQNAVDLGLLRNPVVIWFARRLEAFVYRKAHFITVHSEGNRAFLLTQAGVPGDKVKVMPNWVDTETIAPGDRNNGFRVEYGLDDQFIVLFAGTMGWSQGLDVVVEAASLLQAYQDILFLLVGDGVDKERLMAKAQALDLPNVRFLPMQPWERYPLVLNAADVCLVTLRPEVRTPVVPSKLLTIMASGRPVVASLDLNGDAPEIVEAAQCGYAVEPGNPEKLAQTILALYNSPALREKYGQNGRQYAEEHFSRGVRTGAYERLFLEVCDHKE